MYRLLGFCLGSVASVSALMFLIGWPDFHLSGETSQTDRYDMAVQKLKAKQVSTETPSSEPVPAEPKTDGKPDSPAPTDAIEAIAIDTDVPATVANERPIEVAEELADSAGGSTPPPDPRTAETAAEEWHTIWTPFRSRIAADGFVSRLESVTGLDYRVVQIKAGLYEVAFAYAGQAELDTNLARISAATGLDLGTDTP